jgi:hypothetical protein
VANGRPWRLDILIPGLILAAFLCDVAGRFVRLEPWTFRGDEALSQFRSEWLPGPYEANRCYRNERCTGELAVMSNQPEYRVFRKQVFTTDAMGFRNVNAAHSLSAAPQVLMAGSSFTVGSGSSDSQTLPVRVEALSGCRTFNAGGVGFDFPLILALVQEPGMRDGLVILECLERYAGNPVLLQRPSTRWKWFPYRDRLITLYWAASHRLSISPLRVILQRTYKSFQNDRVLPNVHKARMAVRHLRDGQPMLFLRNLEQPARFDTIGWNVDAFVKLRDDLRAAGCDLALMIVPEKLTVYRPLLRDLSREGDGAGDGDGVGAGSVAFLAELEQSVRARGIAVVNLAPVLAARARLALEVSETVYWPDDTHWNPQGIEAAAEAVCDAFGLRNRCGRRPAPSGP